ncbi:hypothetical protein FWC63_00745 [Candidatus Saccharibacteria bacterium]|nr:hypothetical protein [Candidatus Saccharibacteria bacterium]
MKKIFLITTLLAIVALLAACGGDEKDIPYTPNLNAATPSTPAPNAPTSPDGDEDSTNTGGQTGIVRGSLLPNWERDFSADGFIGFDQFIQQAQNEGSEFRLISARPLEFTDGRFIVAVDTEQYRLVVYNADRNANVSEGAISSFNMRDNGIDRALAIRIWDVLTVLGEVSSFDEVADVVVFRRMTTTRRDMRTLAHQEALNAHPRRGRIEQPLTQLMPSGLVNPNETTSMRAYNIAMEERGFNFMFVNELQWWNRGGLFVELRTNTEGHWGIVIHDGWSGIEVAVYDSYGWWRVEQESLEHIKQFSSELVHSLWGVMFAVNDFTTMEQVLAEEATLDTFRQILNIWHMMGSWN